ncbi:DNA-binding transcriptional MocR family regulator [Sinorhizobium kostiense]|uniref:DNA-binding transcriptional MocR family regulator n=1 Tax=Sinorhizobium kostiense TaxID=76747 RepID=A0ABS4R1A4_9HYPH|nr:PLP-dependent aminotransferase family protein [Sinorhizobium kostiense]MBP2236156.1 DNA-binding transcriptional MocR family regulator [Sinorhizobium kostiense]
MADYNLIGLSQPGGNTDDRAAGAKLLSCRFGSPVSPERVIVSNGTQAALHLLFRNFSGPGKTVLSEGLSYGVLKAVACQAGVSLRGISLDTEGLAVDALRDSLVDQGPKPGLLYCNPTVHNPTTATMSQERRLAIADIARSQSIQIIEDDVLGLLHPESPPPIAALAPDITWYVMGLTKCIAHGTRIAYLVAPDEGAAKSLLEMELRYSSWFPAPLQAALTRLWIDDGTAAAIAAAIRAEMDSRHDIARQVLSGQKYRGSRGSMHIWLSLPKGWSADTFADAAAANGVLVRPARLFAVDDNFGTDEIRISLSSPPNRSSLIDGLSILAGLLADRPI